jgi:glycerate dehydrogenase
MKKAVFLDRASVGKDLDISMLTELPYEWHLHENTLPSQVADRIKDAAVVITNKAPIDAESFAVASELEYIGLTATGFNIVDTSAAKKHQVVVSNAVSYGTPSIVQHCWSLILNLTTRLNELQTAIKQGRWQQSPFFCLLDYPVYELSGKTLGIVGYGTLGKGVAEVARAFGMEVEVASLPGRNHNGDSRTPFPELIKRADVLSLHCPLTTETENLINAGVLAQMKNSALLINTARGGLVEEQPLLDALRQGEIAGAALDVLRVEPPDDGNPLMQVDLPNLIITPHAAWVAVEARERLMHQVADCLVQFSKGQPRNQVA